ncbi:MAG: glycosyltransferase family 4 protein [Spirochaetota bacterium]
MMKKSMYKTSCNHKYKKKSIIIVCNHSRYGGDNISIVDSAKEIKKYNINVVFIIPENGMIEYKLQKDHIIYHIIDHRINSSTSKLQIIKKIIKYLFLIIRVKPSVLHANDIHCNKLIALLGKSLRIKTVCSIRYIINDSNSKYYLSPMPDFIVFNSMFMKKHFNSIFKEKYNAKQHIIYNGFYKNDYYKPEIRNSVRNSWNVLDENVVGIIGNICKTKGHFDFIEIAKRVKAINDNFKFVIIGQDISKDQSNINKIEELVRKYNLSNYFILHGVERDIGKVLSGLDIVLFPTYWESFGRVAIEALLAKKFIVSSKVGGLYEILNGNPAATLVEQQNIDGFVNSILNIVNLSYSNKLKKLKAGSNIACERFSIHAIIEEWINIYYS